MDSTLSLPTQQKTETLERVIKMLKVRRAAEVKFLLAENEEEIRLYVIDLRTFAISVC